MITISLCMIVKNEQEVLARCLDSVKEAVDEIIIVDTGSTDRTKEIARRYTDHVYDFEWINDFSAARNEAFSKASMDYQMWLDADDVLLPADVQKLKTLKKTLPSDVDIVTMWYHISFDQNQNPTFLFRRERLSKRAKNFRWQDPVHEYIAMSGKIFEADIAVTHKKENHGRTTDRNLKIYEQLEQSKSTFSPRQQYYFARELKDHGLYHKSIYYFNKFLDGKNGWMEDNIGACLALAACYRAIGNEDMEQASLLRSFLYDSPRAEALCELGYFYKRKKDYLRAANWFQLAAGLDQKNIRGFIRKDYFGYIPNIELCVCHYHLGDLKRANDYNEEAAQFKPEADTVLQNRAFFAKKLAEKS